MIDQKVPDSRCPHSLHENVHPGCEHNLDTAVARPVRTSGMAPRRRPAPKHNALDRAQQLVSFVGKIEQVGDEPGLMLHERVDRLAGACFPRGPSPLIGKIV